MKESGAMKATIFVDRLRVHAPVGVDAQERIVGNDLEISVKVNYPPSIEAGKDDNLEATVNYAEIVDEIHHAISHPALLLERIAWLTADALCRRWPSITGGEVTVKKLAPPVAGTQCDGMGVTFQWSR